MCSCGEKEFHRVAKRRTGDGVVIVLWSDGGVTNLIGGYLGGMGRPGPIAAGWKLMSEALYYDWIELPTRLRELRKEAR